MKFRVQAIAFTSVAALMVFALPANAGSTASQPDDGVIVLAQSGGHGGGQGGQGAGGGHGGGSGGQGGQGQGGQGQGDQGGGKGGHSTGAGSGDNISGKDLGRLNMARAFLSPGFDAAKIDDPEAPLMQIIAYKDALASSKWDAAVLALAKAATAPISTLTVTQLDMILGVSFPSDWDLTKFAAEAEAKNKELRETEGE
jgi:hypothetical protein